MNYKMTNFRREKLSVTKAEDFYSLKNALNRGPSVLTEEFRGIQDEMFRVKQNMYLVLKDALKLGLTKRDVRKILMKRNFSGREISALLRGKFIPFKASDPLMQKRVRDAKKAYPDERIEKSFFYPRREFNKIMREYRNKSLKPETSREPVSQIEVPEVPKVRTASVLPRLPRISVPTESRGQTPLPPTPAVDARQVASVNQNISPRTGLTQTETALLSPQEQAMRLRQRGIA